MDSVELVKQICKERKIPISKLERDCDFSNGYIRRLKEGKFPSDRLKTIADYLGITVEYLATGGNVSAESAWYLDDETARVAQEVFSDPGLRMLMDAARTAKPEDVRLAVDMLRRMKGNG